jgi:hypothetical protein
MLRLASVPSRLSAALRPRAAGRTALTGLSVEHCVLLHADPVLVSLKTLQHWLWSRLQASLPNDA